MTILHLCVTTFGHVAAAARQTGLDGQVVLRGDDKFPKAFAIAASIALHGALLGALMLEPGARFGAPTGSEHGVVVLDIQLVSSADSDSAPSNESKAQAVDSASILADARSEASALGAFPPQPIGSAGSGRDETAPQPSEDASVSGRASPHDEALRSSYQSMLYAHVLRHRYYPDEARPGRLRGVVRVQFALSRNGWIMSAWVETSSGHTLLDEAALEALRRAQPLPAIPAELPDEMEVLLPLDYLPPKVVRAG